MLLAVKYCLVKMMRKMLEYFPKQYAKLRLNEYAPLDIGEIEKRIAEHHG